MCGLCGVFGVQEHWSDNADGKRRQPAHAERMHRLGTAQRMLKPFGLSLREWAGRYVIANRTGKSEVIEHLGLLWQAAERLTGASCDPLDPAYLEQL